MNSTISSFGIKLLEMFGEKIAKAIVDSQKTILRYGDLVGVLVCDGKFVMNDLNAECRLFAREKHIQSWETFKIVDRRDPYVSQVNRWVHYYDQVALMAVNNRCFIGSNIRNDAELTAVVNHVKEWETFDLLPAPNENLRRTDNTVCYGNSFILKAVNGRYVLYNRDGDQGIYAWTEKASTWETFYFIDPKSFS